MAKKLGRTIMRARNYYVRNEKATFADVAKKFNVTEQTVTRWQSKDIKEGKDRWGVLRSKYWEGRERKDAHKELIQATKKEVANIFDKDLARTDALLALNNIKEKLLSPEIVDKMTSQAKIRDLLDTIKEISKQIEGLGYADLRS